MIERVSLAEALAGAAPLIATPDAAMLARFGAAASPPPLVMWETMVQWPTAHDVARYGYATPRRYYAIPAIETPEPVWMIQGDAQTFYPFDMTHRLMTTGFAAMLDEALACLYHSAPPLLPAVMTGVVGDSESAVPADTIKELVAYARTDNREDFMWLARSEGVEDPDELWRGTRARLGLA